MKWVWFAEVGLFFVAITLIGTGVDSGSTLLQAAGVIAWLLFFPIVPMIAGDHLSSGGKKR